MASFSSLLKMRPKLLTPSLPPAFYAENIMTVLNERFVFLEGACKTKTNDSRQSRNLPVCGNEIAQSVGLLQRGYESLGGESNGITLWDDIIVPLGVDVEEFTARPKDPS
jgi:hypothetical protein